MFVVIAPRTLRLLGHLHYLGWIGGLLRKGSFGTHSPEGSRYIERMLTTVTTLQQQQRNVLDYLTEAMRAHLHGQAAPSLLPGS